MEGIVPSAKAVSTFAEDLRGVSGISKVTIGEITNNTATGVISVGLEAELTQANPSVTPGPEGGMMPETQPATLAP